MMVTMNVSYQQVAGYQERTWMYVLAFSEASIHNVAFTLAHARSRFMQSMDVSGNRHICDTGYASVFRFDQQKCK